MTWGDDDHLYTAYGDGNGFEPFLKEKLSLGLARIEGGTANFLGVNLRAPTLEQKGDGKAGRASAPGYGCSISGTQRRVRNWRGPRITDDLDVEQLKFTSSFGCPTSSISAQTTPARDAFVYIYSADSDASGRPIEWCSPAFVRLKSAGVTMSFSSNGAGIM